MMYVFLWTAVIQQEAAGTTGGPSMGGPKCRLSTSRNGHFPCHYLHTCHVEFEIA